MPFSRRSDPWKGPSESFGLSQHLSEMLPEPMLSCSLESEGGEHSFGEVTAELGVAKQLEKGAVRVFPRHTLFKGAL